MLAKQRGSPHSGAMDADAIRTSLEQLAERVGDPAPLVYRRLFETRPEVEALFVGDRTGAARGEMLAQTFEILIDLAEGGRGPSGMIGSELVNHEGLGVPPDAFASFFHIVADVVRDGLGPDWTPRVSAAWDALLARADERIQRQAGASGLSISAR